MKKILFFHGFYASGQCVPAVAEKLLSTNSETGIASAVS